MAQKVSVEETDSRLRATAFRHAQNIQDKKAIQTRIVDLIIEAFDLPMSSIADPAHPDPSEALHFKQCLKIFQASDFDDLVTERNIDDRCGYALCPKPNIKITGGEKVWNHKSGKDFGLVPKAEMQRWCSEECGDRALFARAQLGKEPAWVRNTPVENIRLLDEVRQSADVAYSLQNLSLRDGEDMPPKDDLANRLHELALERGEPQVDDTDQHVSLVENLPAAATVPEPPKFNLEDVDLIEGHHARLVRFAEDDSDRSDEEMSIL